MVTHPPSKSAQWATLPAVRTPAAQQRRVFSVVMGWTTAWALLHLYVVAVGFSNAIFWLTYYVPNYEFGFVRRGLGGEIISWLPDSCYFPAAYTLLWASTVVWLTVVAVFMRRATSAGVGCARRTMLALAIPVLPFALSYALYSPHPELFGMSALLAYILGLTRCQTLRATAYLSATYGSVTAVLALLHEAIPLQMALGAVLAIVVLPKETTRAAKRLCAALAVGPGLLSTLAVAAFGHRDVAAKLCGQLPHGNIDNPWAVTKTPGAAVDYLLGRIESQTDFHDWVCENALPILDADTNAAMGLVAGYGVARLLGSFLLGLIFFLGTMWIVRYLSAVPIRVLLSTLKSNPILVAVAATLFVPIFATGVDWTRWWIIVSADVELVYIAYAITRPEIERATSHRTVTVFMWVVMALAVLPLGAANNVGV